MTICIEERRVALGSTQVSGFPYAPAGRATRTGMTRVVAAWYSAYDG